MTGRKEGRRMGRECRRDEGGEKLKNGDTGGNRLVRVLNWTGGPAGRDNVFTARCQGDGKRVRASERRRIIKAVSTFPC